MAGDHLQEEAMKIDFRRRRSVLAGVEFRQLQQLIAERPRPARGQGQVAHDVAHVGARCRRSLGQRVDEDLDRREGVRISCAASDTNCRCCAPAARCCCSNSFMATMSGLTSSGAMSSGSSAVGSPLRCARFVLARSSRLNNRPRPTTKKPQARGMAARRGSAALSARCSASVSRTFWRCATWMVWSLVHGREHAPGGVADREIGEAKRALPGNVDIARCPDRLVPLVPDLHDQFVRGIRLKHTGRQRADVAADMHGDLGQLAVENVVRLVLPAM